MDERFVKKVEKNDLLRHIEEKIRRRLAGSVRNLHLILSDDGLVMRGCVPTYYSKQLAKHRTFEIQEGQPGEWWLVFDTSRASPDDFPEQADRTCLQTLSYVVGARSIVGLISGAA